MLEYSTSLQIFGGAALSEDLNTFITTYNRRKKDFFFFVKISIIKLSKMGDFIKKIKNMVVKRKSTIKY